MSGRLLAASHTLPLETSDGRWRWRRPLEDARSRLPTPLRLAGGLWIGWSGAAQNAGDPEGVVTTLVAPEGFSRDATTLLLDRLGGYDPEPAVQTLWPLLHGLPGSYELHDSFWPAFERLNRGVADVVGSLYRDDDRICVTDPRLVGVAEEVRREHPDARIGLSLQLPFPSPELLFLLPRADRWLGGLLAYDVVALRCASDLQRALACVERLHPEAQIEWVDSSREAWISAPSRQGSRITCLGVFPEAFDATEATRQTQLPEVRERVDSLRETHRGRRVMFAADTLDPVRGVPHKIRAFGRLLDRRPDLRDQVVLIQQVEPWHPDVPGQVALRREIETAVGEVNGRHGYAGRVPVQYLYRPTTSAERLAYYQVADVTVVTPIRDACCRAAQEFCAARTDSRGVLVMSELTADARRAGDGALRVNPLDEAALTSTLEQALNVAAEEQAERMETLRGSLLKDDGAAPTRRFLRLLESSGTSH